MIQTNRSRWTLHTSVATVLCAALLTTGAMAGPKLQTIAVTPIAKSISVGQKQTFSATGTFSNGSKQSLGPALSNIATGSGDTCALLTSGGVECWGFNEEGELGDGNTTNSLSPRPVKGISTATVVAFGESSGCALLASRAVQCWGANYSGQLGGGATVGFFSTTPVTVIGISTATAVAVGTQDGCAVLASGAVQCWGYNYFGQLGNGSNTDSSIPVNVIGISTATAVAVGGHHTCALLVSGAVKCWGDNNYGELGNGSSAHFSNTPVTVSGISNATAVAAGDYYSCALLASGAVKCWGYNSNGQLGDGTGGLDVVSTTPVSVAGISTAVAITVGEIHACAVLQSSSVQCWGANYFGELGDGTTTSSNTPVTVHSTYAPTSLSAGTNHTCALFSGGVMTCWGRNYSGQLGRLWRDNKAHPLPVTVAGTPGVVWQSSDPSKATITDRGVATGLAVGNATITATTAGFVNDNALLTVK
jgi:alpha-tubulin suppressor-like RCC1 family protein